MKNLFCEQLKQSILEISDVSMQDNCFEKDISLEIKNFCPLCDKYIEDSYDDHKYDYHTKITFRDILEKMKKNKRKTMESLKSIKELADIFTELSIYISPLPKEKEEFEKVCKNYMNILNFGFCK